MNAKAEKAQITVSPDRVFEPKLSAEQIALLLNVLYEAHFQGKQAALVSSVIKSLQDPLLLEAHGAKTKEQNGTNSNI